MQTHRPAFTHVLSARLTLMALGLSSNAPLTSVSGSRQQMTEHMNKRALCHILAVSHATLHLPHAQQTFACDTAPCCNQSVLHAQQHLNR